MQKYRTERATRGTQALRTTFPVCVRLSKLSTADVEEKQNFEKTFNRVSRRQGEKHSNNSVMFLEIKAHPFPALKSEISTPSHSK